MKQMPQFLILLQKQKINHFISTMFSSSLSQNNPTSVIEKHHGVNLADLQCNKLHNSAIYSKYLKDELHYAVDAVQKGREPPTKIGLKRLIKKNRARALKKKQDTNAIPELNPKAPEEICLKAIRTEFRTVLQKNHIHQQEKKKEKSLTIYRRKEHQRHRRNELIRLVKKYQTQLLPHFGQRLKGYGRCPKVSRQQIKDYLKTLGIEANLDQVVKKQPSERRVGRNKGGINRNQRIPRGARGMPGQRPVLNQMPGMVPLMGQPPLVGPPHPMGPPLGPPFMGIGIGPMNPMSLQMIQDRQRGIFPFGNPPPPMGIPIGPMNPMSLQMIQNRQRGIFPFGNPPPPMGVPHQRHTPPILKEQDFPTLP